MWPFIDRVEPRFAEGQKPFDELKKTSCPRAILSEKTSPKEETFRKCTHL